MCHVYVIVRILCVVHVYIANEYYVYPFKSHGSRIPRAKLNWGLSCAKHKEGESEIEFNMHV